MEALVIVAILAAALAVFVWMRRRASPQPVEDAWEVPPAATEGRSTRPPEPQVLDRTMVLGRDRAFDPTAWDDSPDGLEDEAAQDWSDEQADALGGEDLPRFLDREYLERKNPGAPEA